MLKAVIFDIDGTLIDSVDLHARSWVETFARFGVTAALEDVRGHIGEGADFLIPTFVPPGTPKGQIKRIEQFRADLFKRKYLAEVKPFPKVRELFGSIKAEGCQLVLASSCAADEIDQYKAIAGVTDMTDHDVTADDAASSKPSPDIFLKALDLLVPLSPSETCVVGDTKYDGEAARRAGIPFIGVLSGGSTKRELERSGAIAIYRDPADLLAHWSRWRDLFTARDLTAANT
jgi:HAD superfamily hydrolase (TIGR01509 family)